MRVTPWFLGLALLASGAWAAPPALVGFQGRLTDTASEPIQGVATLTARVYTDATTGTLEHTEVEVVVTDQDGIFTATLGDSVALDPAIFAQPLWVGITVDEAGGGSELVPRIPLRAAPYALEAIRATQVGDLAAVTGVPNQDVASALQDLADRMAAVEAKTASIHVSTGETGTDVGDLIFTGVDLHLRSGSGATDGAVNGHGNLVLGYNEDDGGDAANRGGSHNLVLGTGHRFPVYGGLLHGVNHSAGGPMTALIAGRDRVLSGPRGGSFGGPGTGGTGALSCTDCSLFGSHTYGNLPNDYVSLGNGSGATRIDGGSSLGLYSQSAFHLDTPSVMDFWASSVNHNGFPVH